MICTIPIADQLLELASLRDGWLDGEGAAISSLTLLEAGRRVREHVAGGGPLPFMYPREDGGISVEWDEDGGGQFVVEPIAPIVSSTEAAEIWRKIREDQDDE